MPDRRAPLAALLTGCLTVSACAGAGPTDAPADAPAAGRAATAQDGAPATAAPAGQEPPSVPYTVAIEGPLPDELRALLTEVSDSQRLLDQPPANLARLRRRAEQDVDRLLQALRSRGYYAAEAGFRLDTAEEPVALVFEVAPGPLYRMREVTLEVQPQDPAFTAPDPAELGIDAGEPAESRRILDAEAALLARAEEQGFPLAELGERRAVVDHDADAMDLTLRLDLGPQARFGPVRVTGLSDVEEGFVRGRIPWQEGQLVTPERLAAARQDLLETQLFATARIRPGSAVDEAGQLPVTVELSERKHRSIGLGVRYRTDEGPGGSVSWEHRNLLGEGERLETEFDGSGIGYHLTGDFRKPDFLVRDQALVVGSELAYEDTDAFESTSIGASGGLERRLAHGMTAGAALAFRAAEITEAADDDTESFGLLSLPLTFSWDRSDDLLDPAEGGRLSLANTPFVDTFGSDIMFNKTLVGYSHYLQVLDQPRVVLAGRMAVGILFGAERDEVPADERFYAGGGGSVRGFGFQLAGELDADDDPLGGRSLLEVAGEVRVRITETIGAVAFVDAGAAFEAEVPTFDEELRVGAGVGARYFSPIGPLRLDLGVPINRRDVDDAFQLYISVGQAF